MGVPDNKDLSRRAKLITLLRQHSSELLPPPSNARHAGVALILRAVESEPQILFIRRAERENDPWSGHIALPGGLYQQSDSNLMHTVIRETQEEVGITLTPSECAKELPFEKPYTSDQRTDLIVFPFVFLLSYEPTIIMNHEVSEVMWVCVDSLLSGKLNAQQTVHFNANHYRLPGYRVNERSFVWGLTYRVLQHFFSIIDDTV